jgi:hypothetical protein
MKTLFRWAFRLFLVLIVLLIAAILLLDTMAREFVEYQLRNDTGLETKVGHVTVGLLHPELTIENLVLYNRAQFGGSPFIELPELHVEYDPDALRSRKLHCTLLRFNLARVNLVEDKQGRRNFEALLKFFAASTTTPATPAPPSHPNHPVVPAWHDVRFGGIDTLNISIGRATYLHMKQPDKVDELKFNVEHQVFTNVKTEQDFSADLIVALLKSNASLMQSGNPQTWIQLFSPPAPPPAKKP